MSRVIITKTLFVEAMRVDAVFPESFSCASCKYDINRTTCALDFFFKSIDKRRKKENRGEGWKSRGLSSALVVCCLCGSLFIICTCGLRLSNVPERSK